ncbi:hypothetical protein A3C23_05830 [Candidatus Roizmanbacteria bacterium RIFCSPHIGHO2_02_FULL_37_13b]|uniref:Non-canonical purine NTP pyrophosphatase n=1 Tax=Candidatus Roizmanbacteria bacterium RIFCSPLOWO2_02_FULL_36_11 TaxID=1802071 RepID=A0A1F7JFR7_9BACT|nr:MAG: hypothetical protein A3C23_05830 [Candidatus Roizmanbacteria bacterium RIFCSPHIGHO2_02_FULL_37_13b]OGK54445.1 MAG: hypothetical protein A3H78_06095 [Candidatus Roizmanbacteria bacterium RIFCSPLOWO2_02_FULL_36_11]
MKILIGTTNKGKQQDYKKILSAKIKSPISVIFPQDLDIEKSPVENGSTFVENSLIKAKYYFEKSGLPTIADDGGIEIPILNNEPGVLSRRWPGHEATDDELIKFTIQNLKEYPNREQRRALLTVWITYYDGKDTIVENESIDGYISNQININYIKGYPYRALFIVNGVDKYYDELSDKEHAIYNHRRKALIRLWKKIHLKYNI